MIRLMTTTDIISVVNLEEKIFNHSLGINFLYDELTINPFANYFVYEINEVIIGYIGYRCYDENVEILNFLIDTKYQSKGLGQELFSESLKRLDSVKTISLEVRTSNAKAINFYIKNGFIKSHIRKNYYGNEDAIVYIKEV